VLSFFENDKNIKPPVAQTVLSARDKMLTGLTTDSPRVLNNNFKEGKSLI
jgi:hypothetical protein